MKNKLLRIIFVCVALSSTLFAQNNNVSNYAKLTSAKSNCDTLKNYSGTDYTLYLINTIDNQNTGYLSGTNSYMDLAKAEKYAAPPTGKQLTGVNVLFAIAKSGNSTNKVKINVWLADGTGGVPKAIVASKQIDIVSIKENEFIFIPFDKQIAISGNFYIGFDIPTGEKDTLAMATCKSGDGIDNTGWEEGADSTWHTYASANMDLQADNIIFPVFCNSTSGIKDIVSAENITIYPNPATSIVNVSINTDKKSKVKINVYNLLGEVIISTAKSDCDNETLFHFDMSNNKSGLYYITISTGNSIMTRQLLLSH